MTRNATDLGTFTARAADINRRMMASKQRRDRHFTALITVHLLIITATVFTALSHADKHYARQEKINQEASVRW